MLTRLIALALAGLLSVQACAAQSLPMELSTEMPGQGKSQRLWETSRLDVVYEIPRQGMPAGQ